MRRRHVDTTRALLTKAAAPSGQCFLWCCTARGATLKQSGPPSRGPREHRKPSLPPDFATYTHGRRESCKFEPNVDCAREGICWITTLRCPECQSRNSKCLRRTRRVVHMLFGWWYHAGARERFIIRRDCSRPLLGMWVFLLLVQRASQKESCSPFNSDDNIFTVGNTLRRFRCAEALFLPTTYGLTDDTHHCWRHVIPLRGMVGIQARTSLLLASKVSDQRTFLNSVLSNGRYMSRGFCSTKQRKASFLQSLSRHVG